MTDSTIERAKFTNGTVLVPVCIQGSKHSTREQGDAKSSEQQHTLIENFPCFIAYDGKSKDDNPLLSSRAHGWRQADEDAGEDAGEPKPIDRIFYGICKQKTRIGRYDNKHKEAQIIRADVIVRGVYDAPQNWLWTPRLLQSMDAPLIMKEARKRYADQKNEKNGKYINFTNPKNGPPGFVPYTSNTGVVLYNMRPQGKYGRGYPFCVSRYEAMMIIKDDMTANKDPMDRQFITIGQFFGHVTDWEFVRKHTDRNGAFKDSGTISEETHRDKCRMRMTRLTPNTPKTRRADRRTFKVFLRT